MVRVVEVCFTFYRIVNPALVRVLILIFEYSEYLMQYLADYYKSSLSESGFYVLSED